MSKRNRKQSYVCAEDEEDDDMSIARQSPRGTESVFTNDEKESEALRTGLDLDPVDGGSHTFNFNFNAGDALGGMASTGMKGLSGGLSGIRMSNHDLSSPLPSSSAFAPSMYNAPQPNYIVKEVHHEGPTKVVHEVEHIHHHHETKVPIPVTNTVIQQVPVKQYVPVNMGGTGYDSDSSDSSDDTHYSSSRRRKPTIAPMMTQTSVHAMPSSLDFSTNLSGDLDFERLLNQASSMVQPDYMDRNYELDSIVSMSDKMMSSKLAELRERNRTANLKVAQMEAEGRKRESLQRDMDDLRVNQRDREKQYSDRVKEIIQLQHDNVKLQGKVTEAEEEREDEIFALKKKHRAEGDNLRLQLEMKEDELDEQRMQQDAMQKHINKLLGKGKRPELGSKAKLINERVRDLQSELQKAEMRVEDLRDKLDREDREHNQVVAEREMIIEKQERQIQAQQNNISTLAVKAQKADQGMVGVNGKEYNVFDVLQDNSKLEVEVQNTKKKLASELESVSKLKNDLELARKGLMKQKAAIIQLGTGHHNQDAQIEQLKDMLQKMTAINQTLIKENTKIKSDFKKQRSEYMVLHKTSTQNAAELEQVRKSLSEAQLREKHLRKEHNEAQMQLIDREGMDNKNKTLRGEIKKLKHQLKDCRTKIDDAQAREVDATLALDQLHEAKKLLDDDLNKVENQVQKASITAKNLAGANMWHSNAHASHKHTEVSG